MKSGNSRSSRTSTWDLTALLNAADPRASMPERHMWLVRLFEWIRQAPSRREAAPSSAGSDAEREVAAAVRRPFPLLRIRHLLNVLEHNPEHQERVRGLLQALRRDIDAVALFADFGFSQRRALLSDLQERLRYALLPASPVTRDLATLFPLLLGGDDAAWLEQLDEPMLQRIAALAFDEAPGLEPDRWRRTMVDALLILVASVQAAGFAPPLRQRMSRELLQAEPFRQLSGAAERVRDAVLAGERDTALREASYLRLLLDACQRAAASITGHLEEYGVSVDIVFEIDQFNARCRRIEQLLDCVLAEQPAPEMRRLVVDLASAAGTLRALRAPLRQHYSLLARLVTERSAETGQHYITRTPGEYLTMFGRALGGGAVLAVTTFLKFGVLALGLSAFWGGFWAGTNYALSFVVIMLAHWTVATKQPAMTAPALAAKLPSVDERRGWRDDAAIESFVDEVQHLIRSQAAGVLGNLCAVGPLVLAVQLAADAWLGRPLIDAGQAQHVLESLTVLGPTPLYAAFTGVLLFASAMIAGWVENWFVFHGLDSAIAWNPRIVARLGAARAQRWGAWWRRNISGLAANVSLGMLLGLTPVIGAFFGLGIDVRHVTLSTGQLAAALGAQGSALLQQPVFWACVAGIGATAVLNVCVSFLLAFRLALRARGVAGRDRSRVYAAIRRRLWRRPFGFVLPLRSGAALPSTAAQ